MSIKKNFLFLSFPHCLLLCLLLKNNHVLLLGFPFNYIYCWFCVLWFSLTFGGKYRKKLRIIFSWKMFIHHNEKQIEFSPKFNVFKFSMTRSSIQYCLVHRQLVFHPWKLIQQNKENKEWKLKTWCFVKFEFPCDKLLAFIKQSLNNIYLTRKIVKKRRKKLKEIHQM